MRARRAQLAGSLGALGVLAALGAVVRAHPGPTTLDAWASFLPSGAPGWAFRLTDSATSPGAVAAASAGLAAWRWRTDRARALSCLMGPALALALVQWVLKPVVGRRLEGLLSYPSGTTCALAGLACALALCLSGRRRLVAGALGAAAVAAGSVGVVALGWHYPTDALGGALAGVGPVLLLDALVVRQVGLEAVVRQSGGARLRAGPGPLAQAAVDRGRVAPGGGRGPLPRRGPGHRLGDRRGG